MDIFICEDHLQEAEQYKKIIRDFLLMNEQVGELKFSSPDAKTLLGYLDSHPARQALYLLDICLEGDMNGIRLGVEIRDRDPLGSIVFITSRSEMSYITFQYQIEALDFILKDNIEELPARIKKCIRKAYEKSGKIDAVIEKEMFTVKTGGHYQYLDPHTIMYIQTSRTAAHRVEIYSQNGVESVYGTLKEFEAALKRFPFFLRSHQSVIVNREYILQIDLNRKMIRMQDGQTLPISVRYIKNVRMNMNDR